MEPGAAELYDQALLGILQHVGNVQDFLRVLFGFLYRKTDFYRLLRHPTDRMGFPPGAAQALVLQVTGAAGLPGGAGRAREHPPWTPHPRNLSPLALSPASPSLEPPSSGDPSPAPPSQEPPTRAISPPVPPCAPGLRFSLRRWPESPPGPRLRVSRAAGRVSSCSSGSGPGTRQPG